MQPNDGRVVSSFIVQALKGEPITVFGDGGQTRSFCYVDDLVEAITRLMATGENITGELAEKVIKLTGSRSQLIFQPLPQNDPRQRQLDLTKAKAALDWEPKVALEDGLKETIAYFKRTRAGLIQLATSVGRASELPQRAHRRQRTWRWLGLGISYGPASGCAPPLISCPSVAAQPPSP